MATIDVPTFEQIATILSQLATNYTNVFADYYNLFYNPVPMDITVQIYDDAGNLNTIIIPNRAKDKTYILNGDGDPNNSVSAPKGSVYQDLTNGTAYIKQFANTDNTGWSEFMTLESLEDYIITGAGNPDGVIAASKGILYVDKSNVALYLKSTATGNTGWNLISADTTNLANKDLSNLSEIGNAKFANPSLSNLSTAGTALINSKENVSNKTDSINSSSTNVQYPTAKAVYDLVGSGTSDLANKSLSNLDATGEDKFVHTLSQVRDCIFKAPNGLPSVSSNIISMPAGTVLLCANGVNNSNQVISDRVITASALSVSVGWTAAANGVVFYNDTAGSLLYYEDTAYFRQATAPSSVANMIWYNPDTNEYKVTSNSGSTWTTIVAAEIGRFSTNSSGTITEFHPYHPMVVAMEDDIESLDRFINKNLTAVNTSLAGKASLSLNNCTTGAFSNLLSLAQTTDKNSIFDMIAPDYTAGIDISLPYTATENGYVFAGVNGIDSLRYVKVNGKKVVGQRAYGGGIAPYAGSVFIVTVGDEVTSDKSDGIQGCFYPMKGATNV